MGEEKLKQLFTLADVSGDGYIQPEEFEAFKVMLDSSVTRVQKYELTADLKKQFVELDANHDGKLSLDECKKMVVNS